MALVNGHALAWQRKPYKQGKTELGMGQSSSKQGLHPTRASSPKQENISCNWTAKNKHPKWEMGRSPKQTFLQRRHGWPTDARKGAPHQYLLAKCKSSLPWVTTSHRSEWLSLSSPRMPHAGKAVEAREPSCSLGVCFWLFSCRRRFPVWETKPLSGAALVCCCFLPFQALSFPVCMASFAMPKRARWLVPLVCSGVYSYCLGRMT